MGTHAQLLGSCCRRDERKEHIHNTYILVDKKMIHNNERRRTRRGHQLAVLGGVLGDGAGDGVAPLAALHAHLERVQRVDRALRAACPLLRLACEVLAALGCMAVK